MTVVVTHTTPADGTFSAAGAAAWDADHALSGLGTMAEQNKTSVDIEGGTIDNTTIGATTPSTGVFTSVTTPTVNANGSSLTFSTLSGTVLALADSATAGAYIQLSNSSTGNTFGRATGSATNIGFYWLSKGTGGHAFTTNNNSGTVQFNIAHTASAVNYVQVTGAATGSAPTISAQGSDSNIEFNIATKGTGAFNFFTRSTARQFEITNAASSINWLRINGSATGNGVQLSAQGTDTNIAQVFQSKGTGAIDLAAGSSGVNISNGGTVTAITRTASGSLYTSIPSVAISAPTTAGGVQSTVTTPISINVASVSNGGTGYTLNDVITIVGGTFATTASKFTVTGVSGGVVTALTASVADNYTAFPSQPASTTGGTGTGLTVSGLSGFVPSNSFVITNAGSGYVEQPTVTFSGGGGSGAAAYATVGGTPIIKGLGTNLDVFTSNANRAFRFYDSNSTGINFWSAANGTTPVLYATGSSNTSAAIITNGTGSVSFQSAGGASTQMLVAHTASAVNYVQVTGAATGNVPVISAQGSDTNIQLRFASKGNQGFTFFGRGGSFQQFAIGSLNNSVNYLSVDGAVAGTGPILSSQGSDTNIDLNLTTKGTGVIKFSNGGGEAFRTLDAGTTSGSAYWTIKGSSGGFPFIGVDGTNPNISASVTAKGSGGIQLVTNNGGNVQAFVAHTASAVNYVQVTGAATGNPPLIQPQGSDSVVSLALAGKNGGAVVFYQTSISSPKMLTVTPTASAVNYFDITSGIAGAPPKLSCQGSDTNIDLTLTPKGTGNVRFGTYTGTALSIAGYIEIKDSGGTVRKLAVVA